MKRTKKIPPIKAYVLAILACCLLKASILAQNNSTFFGINAWMPNTLHSFNFNGQYDNLTQNTTFLSNTASGDLQVRMVRFGGIEWDAFWTPISEVTGFLTDAFTNNLEPALTIPVGAGLKDYWQLNGASSIDWATDPSNPNSILNSSSNTNFMANVNFSVNAFGANGMGVKYWYIGNEPNNWGSNNGGNFVNLTNSAVDIAIIARYIKIISQWIKAIDPNAIILGPEFAGSEFNTTGTGMFNKLCDLTDPQNNIFVSSTLYPGKVDIGTYHNYHFQGSWQKQDVIDYPYNLGSGSLYKKIGDMLQWISTNGPTYTGLLAITEFNVTYANETNNGNYDESNASYIAGQYWAECMAIGRYYDWGWWSKFSGIVPWSVQEGYGVNDAGMFDYNGFTNRKRSTYHHLRMMAKEFSRGRVQLWMNPSNNMKAFGVRDCNGGAVMITNQNAGGSALEYYFGLGNQTAPAHTPAWNSAGNVDMDWGDRYVSSDVSAGWTVNGLGPIGPMETHLLILNSCGEVIRTYLYNDGLSNTFAPPIETSYTGNAACICDGTHVGYEWYELDPESNPERHAAPATSVETGIASKEGNKELKIFPNPASTTLNIIYNPDTDQKVTIYSSAGDQVFEAKLQENGMRLTVDVSHMSTGFYICTVETNQGITKTSKVAINR